MKISTLHDLYLEELRDIFNAQKQVVEAITTLSEHASNEDLKELFQEHQEETRDQIERVEKLLSKQSAEPGEKVCRGMTGIIDEIKEVTEGDIEPEVLDAALVVCAQKIKHYEIASHGSLCAFAKLLGYEDEAEQFEEILDEVKEADESLTDLAEGAINTEAAEMEEEEEEEPTPKPRGKK